MTLVWTTRKLTKTARLIIEDKEWDIVSGSASLLGSFNARKCMVRVNSETTARICILAVVANQYDAIKHIQEALKVVLPSI